MKHTILLLLALLISACTGSGSNTASITVTSTEPIDVYQGNGLHLIQSNGGTLTTVFPHVEDTSFVINLDGCKLSYDVATIDPVNYAFWLTQSVAIEVDMASLTCSTPRTYTYTNPAWNGTEYESTFTIN